MAPPAWLPPLNSHENSIIDILVHKNPTPNHYLQTLQINGNEVQGNFYIKLRVYVNFYSVDDEEMKMEFPGLSVGVIKPINVKNPELLITSLQNLILDENIIPFEIENFFYKEHHLLRRGPYTQNFYFPNQNELIEKLTDFILLADRKSENVGHNLASVNVYVKKSVMVPDEEFEPWVHWYNEQKRVYPDFGEEYKRAISVSLMWRRSASRTIVRELESIIVNGNDNKDSDSSEIVFHLFGGVSKQKVWNRLPCHHVFHENCIARWLAGNHVCPLCRHQLPVEL